MAAPTERLRHAVNAVPALLLGRHVLNVLPALRPGDRPFSERDEDAAVLPLLPEHGWYCDIGSQNPVKHSNTYRLYRRGWRGVVVEPNRTLSRLHRVVRPRDTVVLGAAGPRSERADFYEMSPQNLSTFSAEARDGYLARGDRLVRTSSRDVWTLADLLSQHAPEGEFGLLSVDVEGWDDVVLQSNDWQRWRPWVVVVEHNSERARHQVGEVLGAADYVFAVLSAGGKNAVFTDARRQGAPRG